VRDFSLAPAKSVCCLFDNAHVASGGKWSVVNPSSLCYPIIFMPDCLDPVMGLGRGYVLSIMVVNKPPNMIKRETTENPKV
jgi:hypothetical protein